MNHQFIQSVLFDWDKISDESYLTRIEALYKVKKIDFMKPITLFVGENGSGKSTVLDAMTYLLTGNTPLHMDSIRRAELRIIAFRRMTRTRNSAML